MFVQEITLDGLLTLSGVYAIALAGMFSHYLKKWLRGETSDSLWAYLFGKRTWKSTINASLAVLGSCFALFATGELGVPTFSQVIAVFTVGYTCESMFNSDTKLASKPTL